MNIQQIFIASVRAAVITVRARAMLGGTIASILNTIRCMHVRRLAYLEHALSMQCVRANKYDKYPPAEYHWPTTSADALLGRDPFPFFDWDFNRSNVVQEKCLYPDSIHTKKTKVVLS